MLQRATQNSTLRTSHRASQNCRAVPTVRILSRPAGRQARSRPGHAAPQQRHQRNARDAERHGKPRKLVHSAKAAKGKGRAVVQVAARPPRHSRHQAHACTALVDGLCSVRGTHQRQERQGRGTRIEGARRETERGVRTASETNVRSKTEGPRTQHGNLYPGPVQTMR